MSCSYAIKRIQLNNENIYLNLWDTIGQEKSISLTKFFIKDSDCVVIGFSVTCDSDFKEVRDWYKIAKENLSIMR